MTGRWIAFFAGGWVCAVPFVLLGAPGWCQWLACLMGGLTAVIYSGEKS